MSMIVVWHTTRGSLSGHGNIPCVQSERVAVLVSVLIRPLLLLSTCQCGPGYYQPEIGQSYCLQCPAGSFAAEVGQK